MKHTLEEHESGFRPLVLTVVIETVDELKKILNALNTLPNNNKYDNLVHDLEEKVDKLPT